MKKYIKAIIYSLCAIAYSDLIFNPNKGFHFIPFFKKIQIPIVTLLIVSLLLIISLEIPQNKFSSKIKKFKKIFSFIFLISSLLIYNEIFFIFHFYQGIEFIIIAVLSIPIPFIASTLIVPSGIKSIYILLFGLFLTIPTFIYFQYFYNTYEDYWQGIPVVFIHIWIRNWLIFIGLNFIVMSYLVKRKRLQIFNQTLQ